MEYTNRYGDVFTFTKQEDGNVLWTGPFEYVRSGGNVNFPEVIDFIDPSGGPFIQRGQMLSHLLYDTDFNVIVESFERVENGYLIKCKEHKVDPNDFSHLADSDIVGGIINRAE